VGIQANVSDNNMVKHYDASDSDYEHGKRRKTDAQEISGGKKFKKSKRHKKIKDDTSEEEEVNESKRFNKSKKGKDDTSDEEEFKEFLRLKSKRKNEIKNKGEVNDVVNKKKKDVEDDDLDSKTDIQVRGKSRKMNVKTSGGSFDEPSTEYEKDDDHKFSQRVVNDVKMDADPVEDPDKKENRKDVLGSILLTMQACFIVMATKSCDGCGEMSKVLENVSSHLEGWHVMDVYKPHKARMTVKTSSNCSNRYCYQFPTWTADRTRLRGLMCQGRPYCQQLADIGKLAGRRLVMWTQFKLDYLKGGVKAARISLARGMFKLANGAVNLGLWAEGESCRVEATMNKDQVAVLER